MLKRALLACFVLILSYGISSADDLYRVTVDSRSAAEQLTALDLDPVYRGVDNYLVLVDAEAASLLDASGLYAEMLLADVSRDELAIDGRLDRANVELFPLVYEEGNFRLYRVDPDAVAALPGPPPVFPVGTHRPQITFKERALEGVTGLDSLDIDLELLISEVSTDSLISYNTRLQAFYRRTAGTDSNRVARDWIEAKFYEFGYDSTYVDTFQANLDGFDTECYNVVAVKVGSRFPGQQVVVGAHFDAVPASPGADDNGSGTAGVLEIARILSGLETDMTIVFVTFDAEEYGLFGAWHYAEEAFVRGDSIVYMLNMDMLGHYENTTNANLFHGTDTEYSLIWRQLADSLLGINGVLAGASAGSDHYPFSQFGYPVTFVAEYVFSTVYHSYQDSTTYMNFNYMTKLVQGSLATVYYVNATEAPAPSLVFQYPDGVPSIVAPLGDTNFTVQVGGAFEGVPVPGTGQLHYAVDGGSYVTTSLTDLGGGMYEVSLPGAGCGSVVEYSVSYTHLRAHET